MRDDAMVVMHDRRLGLRGVVASRWQASRSMTEPMMVSLPFSQAELARLQEASGELGVEAWARAVVLDLAGDLADVQADGGREPTDPSAGIVAPLLAVGEAALVLEELRALRDELRHSLAEQRLWLQVVYAEVRAQAAYPSQAHEAAACAKAGEQLARMKQLVAEKLKG
jgi:hypothetical protein